jgi:hypothetical protein
MCEKRGWPCLVLGLGGMRRVAGQGVRVDGSRMHVVKPPCAEPISQSRLGSHDLKKKRIERSRWHEHDEGIRNFRLCGADGGVRVRDGLSFSILKVDDEKEKGDAYLRQLGCQERRAQSRAFACPRLEQLCCEPPSSIVSVST